MKAFIIDRYSKKGRLAGEFVLLHGAPGLPAWIDQRAQCTAAR